MQWVFAENRPLTISLPFEDNNNSTSLLISNSGGLIAVYSMAINAHVSRTNNLLQIRELVCVRHKSTFSMLNKMQTKKRDKNKNKTWHRSVSALIQFSCVFHQRRVRRIQWMKLHFKLNGFWWKQINVYKTMFSGYLLNEIIKLTRIWF